MGSHSHKEEETMHRGGEKKQSGSADGEVVTL